MSESPLNGARVLLMEDEFLVAMALESLLVELGCQVVGPFASVADGLKAAGDTPLDAALLDVNLLDGMVSPVAERLADRGVPVMLHTACSDGSLPAALAAFPRVNKPSTELRLTTELEALLGRRTAA